MNPNENYGLWVILTCQRSSISVTNVPLWWGYWYGEVVCAYMGNFCTFHLILLWTKNALKKLKSIKQNKTKYVLMAQMFCFPSDFPGHAVGQNKEVKGWWTYHWSLYPLGMCIFFPGVWGPDWGRRGPLMVWLLGCMKGLRDWLPLPQSNILSSLDSSQANSGSISHIFSHPQASSLAHNIFLVYQLPCLTPSAHIILLDSPDLLCTIYL